VRSWVRATTGIRLPLPEDRIFDEFSKRYG
jgi:hypothetical protein